MYRFFRFNLPQTSIALFLTIISTQSQNQTHFKNADFQIEFAPIRKAQPCRQKNDRKCSSSFLQTLHNNASRRLKILKSKIDRANQVLGKHRSVRTVFEDCLLLTSCTGIFTVEPHFVTIFNSWCFTF